MRLSDFHFHLPDELIAQEPPAERSSSRMLVVDRSARRFFDTQFVAFPEQLNRGDLLVLNNTKVFPARLLGRTDTGARAEIFLIEEAGELVWKALARPGKRLRPGKEVVFDERLSAEVVDKEPGGKVVVRFRVDGGESFETLLQELGRTPLPPYIQRSKETPDTDRERYQTVYARNRGAIAAPTAGLHFSTEIFDRLRERGVEAAEITLHVGYGTFEPVRTDDLAQHTVAAERFEIDEIAAEKLESARKDGRRIVAVGTTTTRTLECAIDRRGKFSAGGGSADLTIVPGYKFKAIGALLTNFHLPESSLLVLVATFGGHQLIMDSYRHAVASRYRFYSYGDCMFIA